MRVFAPAWHRTCVASRLRGIRPKRWCCALFACIIAYIINATSAACRKACGAFLWAYVDNVYADDECLFGQLLCRIDNLKVTNNKNLSRMKQALLNTWRVVTMCRVVLSSALRRVFCRVLLFRT